MDLLRVKFQNKRFIVDDMHKIYLIVLLSVVLIPCAFASLVIFPINEVFPNESNVTVKCTYNGTLVASNWTLIWIANGEKPGRTEHLGINEYVVITRTEDFKQAFLVCTYQDIDRQTTMVTFQDDIKKPIVKCTSLLQDAYKCEWDSIPEATNYKFEHRSDHDNDDRWKVVKWENDDKNNINWVYVGNVYLSRKNQSIRVTSYNLVSQKSTVFSFDVVLNLKPNVTYMPEESRMTATSATLVWDTYNEDIGYSVESQVKYKEYASEEEGKEEKIITRILDQRPYPNELKIENLKPATDYIFSIRSRYKRDSLIYTDWIPVQNRTKDSRPTEAVQGLDYHKVRNDEVLLVWQAVPRENQNGNILGYTIYTMINDSNSNMTPVNVTDVTHSFKDIQYEVAYNVCVAAYNSAGYSPMDCIQLEIDKPAQPLPSKSADLKDPFIMWIVLPICLIVVGVVGFVYKRLKKMEIFIKLPDPKFTQITFEESFLTPTEEEVFDKLRPMSVSKVDVVPGIAEITTNDSLYLVENKSYLKFLKENGGAVVEKDDVMATDNTSYPEFPLSYHLFEGTEKEIPTLNLSDSDDYQQIGTIMVITDKDKNKKDLKIENDTYCQGPPKISENECLTPDQSCDLDYTEYITIVNTSLDKQQDVINHENYVPMTNKVFPKINPESHQFMKSTTSYVPIPVL